MKKNILVLVAALTLSGSAFAQTGSGDTAGSSANTGAQRVDDTPHHEYGWIGLLGLLGLAGLRKQHTHTLNNTGTNR